MSQGPSLAEMAADYQEKVQKQGPFTLQASPEQRRVVNEAAGFGA